MYNPLILTDSVLHKSTPLELFKADVVTAECRHCTRTPEPYKVKIHSNTFSLIVFRSILNPVGDSLYLIFA